MVLGISEDQPISLITDCHGNVYVSGFFFSNQLNFYFLTIDTISNNMSQLTIKNSGSGSQDGIVAKLSPDGSWEYVCQFGGSSFDQLNFYFCTTDTISNNLPQLRIMEIEMDSWQKFQIKPK